MNLYKLRILYPSSTSDYTRPQYFDVDVYADQIYNSKGSTVFTEDEDIVSAYPTQYTIVMEVDKGVNNE
tara:strand:- start:633 stop:839 length:207 start_codon:yes stop_codon:yes gene_type:complete